MRRLVSRLPPAVRRALRAAIDRAGLPIARSPLSAPPRAEPGPAAEPDPGTLAQVKVKFPPGSYYSPIPDDRELAREPRRSQLWSPATRETPGIDWRDEQQLALCRDVFASQSRLELAKGPSNDPNEYVTSNEHNGMFKALDAWILEAMLRHLRPARMIEVGSGFSSLLAARVNRECLDGATRYTAIEPNPRQFLLDGVPGISDLRVEQVQDTPLELFAELGEGDVLFVDTSHAVKAGGDVPWIYNQVLPRLGPGVHVHLHDVFLPHDYPRDWVLDG